MYSLAESYRLRYESVVRSYNDLVEDYNVVVREYNALVTQSQFTDEEIASLIRLCHPDKHDGSEAATRMTQRLLEMRKRE